MTDTETIERQAIRIADLCGVNATLECRVHNLTNELSKYRFWGQHFDEQNAAMKHENDVLRAKNTVLQDELDNVPHVDIVVS